MQPVDDHMVFREGFFVRLASRQDKRGHIVIASLVLQFRLQPMNRVCSDNSTVKVLRQCLFILTTGPKYNGQSPFLVGFMELGSELSTCRIDDLAGAFGRNPMILTTKTTDFLRSAAIYARKSLFNYERPSIHSIHLGRRRDWDVILKKQLQAFAATSQPVQSGDGML